MPRRALRPCSFPECSELVAHGRCEKHTKTLPAAVVQREKRRDPFYGSARWLKCRALKLRRQPLCEQCGKAGEVVHHIEEIGKGGAPLDAANLQTLCMSCHSAIHGYGKRGKE